jgi:hypothetical protein
MERMNIQTFGGIRIFRPRLETELEVRQELSAHLRSQFLVGRYTGKSEINAILQHIFSFYGGLLSEALPPVASTHLLDFLLHQYDLYSDIEQLYKQRTLDPDEDVQWGNISGILRRAVKYLAERVVMLAPDETPTGEETERLAITDKIWICAEEMVNLYISSDSVYSIFPDDSVLEIFPPGGAHEYHIETTRDCPIRERVRLDLSNRASFIPGLSLLSNSKEQDMIIGEALRESIGISYAESLNVLANIIKHARSAPNGFPVLFLHKERTVDQCAGGLSISPEAASRVIEGFTISKANLESEGREIWKPKQEYRAFRRGFFEVPHPTGPHLAFSKAMAAECFAQLQRNVVFHQMPVEWLNANVRTSLNHLSNAAGAWFETVAESSLRTVGLSGAKSAKDRIGTSEHRIAIPQDVGEIDLILYSVSERLLVIGECKLARDSYEPKLFRDDLSDFVQSKDAYITKFRKKIEWVRGNLNAVCQALQSTHNYEPACAPERVAAVIVTHVPSIAACFIPDYPCVSLTELLLNYQSAGKWPYEKGVYTA